MGIIQEVQNKYSSIAIEKKHKNETYLLVNCNDFTSICLLLHKFCLSPVMMMFVEHKNPGFQLYTAFYAEKEQHWFYVCLDLAEKDPEFPCLSKEIYSASLFEREIWEMFGVLPQGSPDLRRLRLHDEVWPKGNFPLRKDFVLPSVSNETNCHYNFIKGQGEGLFEVPVGPVHAGIIGPGHFRFSAAGEPIINLEIRLGFTHRGVEKMMEGKNLAQALKISECVSGDSSFSHSLSFCQAIEKIIGIAPSDRAIKLRTIYLELERMYNHVQGIGGMALDVGFSFAHAFASIMKEKILQLNEKLSGSRYLKGINQISGVAKDIDGQSKKDILDNLKLFSADLNELEQILFSSASFMDRVDSTGILRKKTAEDIGVRGMAARASINGTGDCLARLKIRFLEFKQSIELIKKSLDQLVPGEIVLNSYIPSPGFGLGVVEGWRGPILYWVKIGQEGKIERCKIVDPSFQNWQGLAFAVQGEIIPDFPLCNKSFDLSYSGNDL